MEQQYRQGPPPPGSYGKRIWYLWGPIVIKWVVGIAVSMIAMGVLSTIYMLADQDAATIAMQSEEKMLELSDEIMAQYLKASTLIEGVAALITIPIMFLFFHFDRVKERKRGFVPNRKAPIWKYMAGLLLALAMSLGLNNLIIIGNLSDMSESYQATMEAFYSSPLAVQVAVLAVLIPMSEELVFRGLLFKRLRERASYMQAALYSAVVFGLMHGNMVQMLYGFAMGMMLAYLYEKYGSIKAPIAAHMVMNLLSVLATEFELLDWLMEDSMRIGIVTIVCAFVASTMFVLIQRIEERPIMPDTPEGQDHRVWHCTIDGE